MKIALYIEDGLEQIVLTPESDTENGILGKLHDGTRALKIEKGSFFDCRGGWKRYTPYYKSPYTYGTDSGDESTIIVLRAAQGTPTRSAETTGSVGEADGGPVSEGDAP